MKHSLKLFIVAVVAMLAGCDSSTDSGPDTSGTNGGTPFTFHKPTAGSTFTVRFTTDSAGAINQDTTFVYVVLNSNAQHAGRSGLNEMSNGYSMLPFYVAYDSDGDVDIWGGADIIYGRYDWMAYPYTLNVGQKRGVYFHDSVITLASSSEAQEVKTDTFMVIGKESLQVKGQSVECIKSKLTVVYSLTNLTFGFTTSTALTIFYWYAPSLGFWAKWEFTQGPYTWRYTMIDHSP
jgi:hypothetical protein